jgi:hypothetical protein
MGLASLARFSIYLRAALGEISSHQERSTGQRPVRARCLFLCHAQNPGSAVGARETGWRRYYFFSGEALYAGPDMGTVEAALASGRATAQTIVAARP